MFKHILFATDGSAASDHAATLSISLARTHGARLTCVCVIDPYPYMGVGETNPAGIQAYMAEAQAHAAKAHAKVVAMCNDGGAPVDLQTRVIEELAPSIGIVEAAKEEGADLIVVGSHGRTGIARLMLGSVAGRVVAESPLPVLVTR